MNKKYIVLTIVFVINVILGFSQDNPLHISHKSVYSFLDEMASLHLIDINTALKPYSRMYVYEKLKEIETQSEKLNNVQRKELKFHLLEFNLEANSPKENYKLNAFRKNENVNLCLYPLGVYYNDKWFKISLKPIWGVEYYITGKKISENVYRYWGGGELMGYIGKNISFYVNATDNSQSAPMSSPEKLTQMQGALLKGQFKNTDFFNIRGGLTFSWKWVSLGLIKDNIVWGNAYNGSNILSGRTLPYSMIKLSLSPVKWLEYNYIHGWLASNIIDSNLSYITSNGNNRYVMRNKMIAANMISFRPVKNLYLNFGNSVVYSDVNFQFQYLIPFMVYKIVDDNYNGTNNLAGQNTQMFFDVSSRNIKYLHLYASLFIDELSFKRMFDKQKQSNYISLKTGVKFSGLPKTFSFTFEYTRTNPNTYQHFIPTTTFSSGDICLGNYLGSNAEEFYTELAYRPLQNLQLQLSYTYMHKGTDYIYGVGEPWGLPFMEKTIFYNHIAALKVEWEFMNNCFVYLHSYLYNTGGNKEIINKYNPAYFQKVSGFPLTLMTGFNIGF